MAKLAFKAGTTSKMVDIFIQDSSSTTGSGITGLVYNSASLVAYYHRDTDSSATAITLATMTVGTWATGGFKEVSSSNMPGIYQIGIPNAALASGATSVVIMLKGATNMAPVALEIQLDAWDNQDSVRGGMTALPNAAAASTGGLPTVDANNAVKLQSGTGSNQISLSSGLVTLAGVTHTGATIPTVTTATNVTTVNGLASGVITATSIASSAITAAKFATDAIDSNAVAASAVTEIQSGLATPTNITAGTITTVTNLTNAPSSGDLTSTMKTSVENAVWNAATSSHTTAGSFGVSSSSPWSTAVSSLTSTGTIGKLLADNIDTNIGSRLATSAIALVSGGVVVNTNNDKTGYSLSVAGVKAIWDQATSALTTSGSIGKYILDNLSISGIVSGVVSGVGSLAGIAAADIWSYTAGSGRTLTNVTPGSSLVATTTGSDLSLTKAVSYETTITGLTIPSTWTKIYFTAKNSLGDTDAHAMLQLQESNPSSGSDGLLYINGGTAVAAGVTAADGDLTVDRVAGTVTITLTDDAAVQLSTGSGLAYDIKMLTSDSKSQVLVTGNLSIGTTPTLSVS